MTLVKLSVSSATVSYAKKQLFEVFKIVDSKIGKDRNAKYLKKVQQRSGSNPKVAKMVSSKKTFQLTAI